MKNLIKNSIVLVVLSSTLLVNANEISSLRNLKDQKTTMLTLLNVNKGNQLILKDTFGKVLYRQSIINSGEFVKGFDLTSLPNGKYYFLLKGDLQKKIIPFKINKNKMEYNKDMESTIKKDLAQSKKENKTNKTEKKVLQVEGMQRRVLNFKGAYFYEYNNSKK